MKYLLMELPAFITGLLLGIFAYPIFTISTFYLIVFIAFLILLYQGLTYLYVTNTKIPEIKKENCTEFAIELPTKEWREENKIKLDLKSDEIPIPDKYLKDVDKLKKDLSLKIKDSIEKFDSRFSKFEILKDLTSNGIITKEKFLICFIDDNQGFVEIKNLNSQKLTTLRFDSLIELNFIKYIS